MKRQINSKRSAISITALPFFIGILFSIMLVGPVQAASLDGFVLGVKDGDTIKVRTQTGDLDVRLYGIDTPETAKKNKPGQPYGRQATQFTNREVRKKKVRLDIYD
jgi:endonuclease YncB( thermonuclease family)